MTPIQKIEKGLGEGDLKLIAEGFAALTGRTVTFPAGPDLGVTEEAVQALSWYADPANYSMDSGLIPAMLDGGQKARDAFGETAEFKFNMPKILPNPKSPKTAKTPASKKPAKPKPPKKTEPPAPSAQSVTTSIRPKDRNWDPPPGNKFKDNKTDAKKDISFTKKVCEKQQPTDRRPPHDDPEVEVECDECDRPFTCRKSEVRVARKSQSGEDQIGTQNYCPRCITTGR